MKWKLALAQHPMYLLIREDTQCAERTPPWGAPDISAYIDRVKQNLQALEEYPQLKLGYEWSGVELELLSQDAPEVLEQMIGWSQKGRVQFYNGTYAQPHLQILSSESNYRQFESGSRVYRETGLPAINTYAHQEASVHDQVPQLLKAFGIRFAVTPGFLSTLAWLDHGELVLHGVRGPRFVQGHEFVNWQGLDGTQVPLYLHQPVPREYSLGETLAREEILGMLRVPPVLIDMPDMIAIDQDWMSERTAVDFVLLDEILQERLLQAPPGSKARLYTHWSYLEGIRAEELSRSNLEAEQTALQAEALTAMGMALLDRPAEPAGEIWKTILAAQHHDVYCFSAPELRDKAIGWLRNAKMKANSLASIAATDIASQVNTLGPAGQCVVIFNTLPHPRKELVQVDLPIEKPLLLTDHGETIPVEILPAPDDRVRLRFITDLGGFGYRTLWLRSGGEAPTISPVAQPFLFENEFFKATIYPDGTIASLIARPVEEELLDAAGGRGNRLSATDSAAISLKGDDNEDRTARYTLDPPIRGTPLEWAPAMPASLLKSQLGLSLTVEGSLGLDIKATARLVFYNDLPRIDLTWHFTFNHASVGTFFDDESKLLVHWPLGFTGEIFHDIPFGAVQTRCDRSFFPTSWVDISDGKKGLAFFHSGTPHYWVTGNALVNLIAWGEDTDAIHNGLGRHRWLKSFDQRLNGAHTIRNALYVHLKDWRIGDVVGKARSFRASPLAVLSGPHPGALPSNEQLLSLKDPALAATALFARGSQLICRVYEAQGREAQCEVQSSRLLNRGIHDITGGPVKSLTPFQIGEISFERI